MATKAPILKKVETQLHKFIMWGPRPTPKGSKARKVLGHTWIYSLHNYGYACLFGLGLGCS